MRTLDIVALLLSPSMNSGQTPNSSLAHPGSSQYHRLLTRHTLQAEPSIA
ncbi:MAG: hypothetical protein ACK5MU_00370 [Candidatus Saccharimonadales bacterium]